MLAVMLPSASPRDVSNQRLLNRLRRAANRAAANNPRTAGLHPTPPTITDNGATSPAITSANPYGCNAANRGVWHVVGGRYGSGGRISAGVLDTAPTDINTYARWEVMADSRYFTARLGPTTVPYRFIVDGRYVSQSGTVLATTTGNTDQYVLLDFGTRAVRRIVVEAMRTGRLAGGFVEDGAALWPVDTSDVPYGVFLGDSYVFGSGPDFTADGVAVQMADRLGVALQASGSGGTGWNQTATGVHRFDQRIVNGDLGLAYQAPEVIFLHASVNDAYAGQSAATVQANALAGLRAARAQYPGVPIVVFRLRGRAEPDHRPGERGRGECPGGGDGVCRSAVSLRAGGWRPGRQVGQRIGLGTALYRRALRRDKRHAGDAMAGGLLGFDLHHPVLGWLDPGRQPDAECHDRQLERRGDRRRHRHGPAN
jgi:hypothetical protein